MNKQDLIELNEHIYAFDLTGDLSECTKICGGIVDILRDTLHNDPEWNSDVEDAGLKFLWERFGDVAHRRQRAHRRWTSTSGLRAPRARRFGIGSTMRTARA